MLEATMTCHFVQSRRSDPNQPVPKHFTVPVNRNCGFGALSKNDNFYGAAIPEATGREKTATLRGCLRKLVFVVQIWFRRTGRQYPSGGTAVSAISRGKQFDPWSGHRAKVRPELCRQGRFE